MNTPDTDETRARICPNCHARHPWYEAECPDCRVALTAAPPDPVDEPLVSVFRTDEPGGMPLATMALDDAGIEYGIRPANGGDPRWRRQLFCMPGDIVVRASDAEKARDLLVDLERASPLAPPIDDAHTDAEAPVEQAGPPTVELRNLATNLLIGRISEDELTCLVDRLEEPVDDAPEYYIDAATIEMLESAGGTPHLVELLRGALAGRDGIDVRWSRR